MSEGCFSVATSVFIKKMLVGSLSQLSPYRVAARRRILRRLENMQRHSLEGGWIIRMNVFR